MAAWISDAAYAYDGSFDGLLSCVFESYVRKEDLVDLRSDADPQYTLFVTRWVETCPEKANRVYAAIGQKYRRPPKSLSAAAFSPAIRRRIC
ncbi:hypothetical protein HMSSN036_25850 [Paenibacillus macerans]|nr:hypothetical protein HMSSN036_25850 [Paenibacillus macerans]